MGTELPGMYFIDPFYHYPTLGSEIPKQCTMNLFQPLINHMI